MLIVFAVKKYICKIIESSDEIMNRIISYEYENCILLCTYIYTPRLPR